MIVVAMRRALAAALVIGATAATGCKGDPVRCEAAIRNYTNLVYWEIHDPEIAAKPEAERAKLRADTLAEYDRELGSGIDILTTKCVSANNDTQVQCMIDAKTAADAHACME